MTGALSLHAAYQRILHTDGGSRVFQDFGLNAGQRYVSPFRADARHKNFAVSFGNNHIVYFKDFASGDGGTFTALLHGFGYTTFEAQIRFAARLYSIELKDEDESGRKYRGERRTVTESRIKRQATNEHSTKRYRVTSLELADFTPLELETLAKISSGFITRELLERFGIRALRSYTDEGVSTKGGSYGGTHEARFTLVVPSADGNYYGYCYFSADAHSPFPHRSKNFHLKLNDYTAEVKFALGLNELRPNEAAYIVEGIKDCLILLAKGYNAFTLGGVQHRLLPTVVERLHTNNNALTILFDTDFAGIDAAKRLVASLSTPNRFLGTQNCFLPRLERQETKDAPKPTHNDLADYVCLYGFDTVLKQALLPPAPLHLTRLAKGAALENVYSIPAWQLSIKRKLSDDTSALKALANLMANTSRLVLRAPTGCGKTYTVLRHIAQEHFKNTRGLTVFTVPTIALAEQIKQEYRDLKPIVITGSESDLHRLYDTTKPLDTCLIVSVFDSAVRLLDIINEPNTLLVVDEVHKMVQEYDFRTPAMRTMLRLVKQAPRTLCLSATPELLFHEAPMNFTYCDIAVEEQRPLRFTMQDYDKRDKAITGTILQALKNNSADTIMVHINSKSLLKRTQSLLIKHGVPEREIDIITGDTYATSPEYQHITETSRFTRRVILTTSVLDCGVNILNEGRALVIMADEKNEDTIIQIANRFRTANDILVRLFYAAKNEGQAKKSSTDPRIPMFNEQHHFLQTRLSAEMLSEAFNRTSGRNTSANCGLGRKSASRLQDTIIFYHAKESRWTTDECAIMHRLALLRIAAMRKEEVALALTRYGFTHVPETEAEDNAPPESAELAVNTILAEEVKLETKREALENEQTILHLLNTKTPYFLAALNTLSRSKSLKDALPRFCPEALLALYKNHTETAAILTNHAALLRETRTENLVRYYAEARTLGFDHPEAIHLVTENNDPRKWQSFTERLAIKQREAIHLAGLTDSILSKHDREKLRREEEIRRLVRNSAQAGCTFTGADGKERHIPNAIRTKKGLAERVNAYTSQLFRLTQQKAGELVDALFHVRYVRERIKTESGTRFSGYYAFANNGTELKRKTLAEFVSEYGVDGAKYERQFMERAETETRLYDETQEQRAMHDEAVCAGSGV